VYRLFRTGHKWIGAFAALLLAVIAVTGFLLATKGTFGWIRPPEADGQPVEDFSSVVSVHQVMESAFAHGIPEIKTPKDIDRIDYRPKSNIFKVLSKEGYHELQVDGATGKVLQVAQRNDQLAEDIHDLSFFHDLAKDWGLPLVAIALLSLSITGLVMFFVPIARRAKFKSDQKSGKIPAKTPKEI
jgi:uncharacterized iron-regulated membrane protein